MADKEFQLPYPSCRSKNQSLKNSYYSLTADNEDIPAVTYSSTSSSILAQL